MKGGGNGFSQTWRLPNFGCSSRRRLKREIGQFPPPLLPSLTPPSHLALETSETKQFFLPPSPFLTEALESWSWRRALFPLACASSLTRNSNRCRWGKGKGGGGGRGKRKFDKGRDRAARAILLLSVLPSSRRGKQITSFFPTVWAILCILSADLKTFFCKLEYAMH